MFKWLKFWEQKTVDTIVASFHRVVDDLHAHAGAQFDAAVNAAHEAEKHLQIEAIAMAEADRAREIAAKIKALLS